MARDGAEVSPTGGEVPAREGPEAVRYDAAAVANEDTGEAEWTERPLLGDGEHVVYRYRWAVLLAVFLINCVNAALWLTYSPITDLVHDKYGVPETVVNILSYCMSGLYGPVVWAAAPVIKRIGFANGCRAAAFVTCCGAVIRCFAVSHHTFAFLVAGQVVSGVGRPVISQLLTLVSQNWFAPRQRALATTLAALGNPLGIGLGFVLPTSVTRGDADKIPELHVVTAVLAGGMLAYVLIVVREKPATPPSHSAGLDPALRKSYVDELRTLSKSPMYWLNALSFGIAFGQSFAVAILLNQFMKPFGYGHTAVSIAGVMVIIPGIVGSGIVAGYLGRRPVYREVLMLLYVVCAGAMQLVMWLALRTGLADVNPWLILGSGVFGFFVQPAFAVALELAAETVFPVSPATAGAGVIMCAQYVGLIMSISLAAYVDHGSDEDRRRKVRISGCIMSGCFVLGCAMMAFFNAPQLRREYEAKQDDEEGSDEDGESRPAVSDADEGGERADAADGVASRVSQRSRHSSRGSRAQTWRSGSFVVGTPQW
eukprot:TRINITY_DN19430_c0_g1_i1.p1 TRINITY_DN19430_c0_g1~~TRINITY_DN19430_c0_g1_i1.p1  ORF type:complete len:574 (+),score=152.51 TRINITY_DN19430_c0_g1_i1:105-1724(+)